MPTYGYLCESCGCEFEQFQPITAKPIRKCPKCSRNSVKRLIGCGSGVIFRGSGFYQTDYRSESYKKSEESQRKTAEKDKNETKCKQSKTTQKKQARKSV